MDIFNSYTTDDVLWGDPYIDNKLKIYPLKVKQYKQFQQYLQYFMFSKKHYGVDNKTNLFDCVLSVNTAQYQKQLIEEKLSNYDLLLLVIRDLEKAFSIACRDDIQCDLEQFKQGEIVLLNKDSTIKISKSNFDKARRIILKQNVISEPKIFDDEIEKELADKWLNAQQKKNSDSITGLGEMANLISCATGKSYEELFNQNIMQLYCDFYRCINTEDFKTTSLFRTVSDDMKIIEYQREIMSQIFADPYSGMWKDTSAFLGGLGVE